MKILVTGAAGNIGSHLIPILVDRGHQIRAVVRSKNQARHLAYPNIEIVEADVMDPKSIAGIADGMDLTYQLVGYLFAPKRHQVETDNLTATKNIARECLKSQVRRIIYSSSLLVYGQNPNIPSLEKDDPNPNTPYGRGKRSAEEFLLSLAGNGLAATILRVGHVYGSGVSSVEEFKNMIARGVFSLPGKGDHLIAPINVDDLAIAMTMAAENKRSAGQIYNVNDDHPLSLKKFSDLLAEYMGKPDTGTLPVWLFKSAALFFETISRFTKRRPFFDRDTVKLLTMAHWGDTSKIKADLGWEPYYKSFNEGLSTCFPDRQDIYINSKALSKMP